MCAGSFSFFRQAGFSFGNFRGSGAPNFNLGALGGHPGVRIETEVPSDTPFLVQPHSPSDAQASTERVAFPTFKNVYANCQGRFGFPTRPNNRGQRAHVEVGFVSGVRLDSPALPSGPAAPCISQKYRPFSGPPRPKVGKKALKLAFSRAPQFLWKCLGHGGLRRQSGVTGTRHPEKFGQFLLCRIPDSGSRECDSGQICRTWAVKAV